MVSPSFFDKQRNLVLLIDAENAPTAILGRMLDRISLYGIPMIRRAYGDWNKLSPKSVEAYKKYGIRLIQQTTYISGKNATDIRLVIDAMDILHEGKVQGFCIISSDSDFTGLCNHLRESGMFVMGMGQSDITHNALKQACNEFVYIDELMQERDRDTRLLALLEPDDAPDTDIQLLPVSNPVAELREIQELDDLQHIIKQAYTLALNGSTQNAIWVDLGKFGSTLKTLQPAFTPKAYGHSKLLRLVQTYTHLLSVRKKNQSINSDYELHLIEFDESRYKNDVQHLLAKTYKQCAADEGWVNLGNLGHHLMQVNPNFDYKAYGHSKLSALIKAQPYMEVQTDPSNETGYVVRMKMD